MDFLKKYWRESLLALLLISNIFVWSLVYEDRASNVLKVYFLDVGQGDAIFIQSPSGARVLVDGGKNRKVVSELGKILPFSDKRIDVVIATHPDADHIGGLPEVISRFDVEAFLEPGTRSENNIYDELIERLEEEEVKKVLATRGMLLNFGDGAKLVILYPRVGEDISSLDINDASIVAKLVYKEKSFLLTGDAGLRTENILLTLDAERLQSDVLKAGHHGSRTSSSLSFLEVVSPLYTVISAGKDNSYGHPHQVVLDNLALVGSRVLSTFEKGAIKFETDGKFLEFK